MSRRVTRKSVKHLDNTTLAQLYDACMSGTQRYNLLRMEMISRGLTR